MKLVAFIRLSRFHFLVGGFLMFGLGALAARPIHASHYLAGQLMVTAAQLTAHYVNEFADYEVDMGIANRTSFSGGSGVLTSGELSPRTALVAGIFTSVIAIVGAVLVASFSPAAAALGIAALVVSWAYSIPPVRLLNTGIGELVTALTVAGLVPLIGAVAQNSSWPSSLWWMCGILVPMQLAMLLAFELPDLETDKIAEKLVLGVRIGAAATLGLISALVLLAALIDGIAWEANGLTNNACMAAMLGVPVAALGVYLTYEKEYKASTLCAVASFALTGLGLVLAIV